MLQSRTFTPAFRFFAGLAAFSFVAAFIVGFSSGDQPLMDRIVGPLTLGWKGGVGNHLAYSLFVGLFALSAGLAGLLVAFRDADPEAEAQVRPHRERAAHPGPRRRQLRAAGRRLRDRPRGHRPRDPGELAGARRASC